MYPSILEVKALQNHLLLLTFDNGEIKKFDMKPYLNTGVFIELNDDVKFRTVKVNFDTVEWANGADFDPEVLYLNSVL